MKTMKKLGERLLVNIDFQALEKSGISEGEVNRYIPPYIYQADTYPVVYFGYWIIILIPWILGIIFKLIINPRKGKVGDLGPDEVESVYEREANSYNWKHHLTTRGMDLMWRRQAAYTVLALALAKKELIRALDLCTGTGLTVKEIERLRRLWPAELKIVGLDYCQKILNNTRGIKKYCQPSEVEFVRGDATSLTSNESEEFVNFEPASFDIITQMFGIGGIDKPLKVFFEVLRLLKPGGQYSLIDMHKPIKGQAGEWPFFLKWIRSPAFEMMCYERVCLPLALERLWAWRDTTPLFYLVRLVSEQNSTTGAWYGFRVVYFEYNPERWWLGLPVMPTGKILLEKYEIDAGEAQKRALILKACE